MMLTLSLLKLSRFWVLLFITLPIISKITVVIAKALPGEQILSSILSDNRATIKNNQPNFIFILTDDQDFRLDSLDYMPNLQKYLIQEGTLFRNHYCTVAQCCPSRVSLLRSQYAHNTNITDVKPPYGGYTKFNNLNLGEDYLPIWMQKAGYSTHYIGKLMNGYNIHNYNKPAPAGFDYQDQLVDPYTYIYDRAVFSKDGGAPIFYKDIYQTDAIHLKAVNVLQKQRSAKKPFFLWVAPVAPHSILNLETSPINSNRFTMTSIAAPLPAARHENLFRGVKTPRHPNFNPIYPTKTASYWKEFPYLTNSEIDTYDNIYRKRLQALQSVDEMIPSLLEELEYQGKLDNTFIVFSSDNGYHMGQHRAFPGKQTNIEEDINVPLIVRGPGVAKGHVSDIVSAHHDLAPTFMALAKGDRYTPSFIDGGVIPWTSDLRNHPKPVSQESFAVEFWTDQLLNEAAGDIKMASIMKHNTYKTLRIISNKYNYKYAVWCTGEKEFYDMQKDPYELNNLYNDMAITGNVKMQNLINRLDALLSVLKSCRAHTCRNPWPVIHPSNPSVKTLEDALNPKYDNHYKHIEKFKFANCIPFYSVANEVHLFDSTQLRFEQEIDTTQCDRRLGENHIHDGERCPSSKLNPYSEYEKLDKKEVIRLINLVPSPSTPAGQRIPTQDELKQCAQPLPDELVRKNIDWDQYGFYGSFGN